MSDGFWYSDEEEEDYDLGGGTIGEVGIDTSGGDSSGVLPYDPKDPSNTTGSVDHGLGTELTGPTDDTGAPSDTIVAQDGEIIELEGNGATGTIYTSAHDFVAGSQIQVYGTSYTQFDGIFTIISTTLTSITYTLNAPLTLSLTVISPPGVVTAYYRPDDPKDDSKVKNDPKPVQEEEDDEEDDYSPWDEPEDDEEDDTPDDGEPGDEPDPEVEGREDQEDDEGYVGPDDPFHDCDPVEICIDSNGVITMRRRSDGKRFRIGQVNPDETATLTSTLFQQAFFTNPQFELGLPRTLQSTQGLLDSQIPDGNNSGSVSDADGTVTEYGNGTTYQIPRPSTNFTNMLGLIARPAGPWVFAFPSTGNDGHHVFYNGTGVTTPGYRNVQNIGTFNGYIWSTATKTSTGASVLLRVDGGGLVVEVALPTSSPNVNWSAAAFGTSTAARAGNSGIALWFNSPAVPQAASRFYFYDGTTWYDYGNALTTASAPITNHLTTTAVDGAYFYFRTGSRSYNRLDLNTAVLYTYPNILPTDANASGLTANDGVVAMYGVDTTNNYGAMWITFGGGVQTLEITGSQALVVVPKDGGNASGFLYRYTDAGSVPYLDYLP